jgi:hypothetical protein
VNITASYPGATPKTINDSVITLIEREMSGVKNLLYYSATTIRQEPLKLPRHLNPVLMWIWHKSTYKTKLKRLKHAYPKSSANKA